ncbi:FAD-dependent oxidoreductase family protein [Striga hermonthica]|uniref:FAD-dependent oxidoreductase domain-containing protein 1 n=1 Tax=Striga hermonthica TaxID=68872 RepID=A0A9N7NLY8_STRHE|nr:FAD-dependent oxidoreductase family protein [Striga hermonthica]
MTGRSTATADLSTTVACLSTIAAGSMLVGRTAEDCSVLRAKVEKLVEAGLGAQFLSRDELRVEEPALELGEEGGAAFMPDDCQLDARRAVTFLEKTNRSFAAEGRYAEFYHEPVTSFIRSESTGGIEAVQTSNRTLSVKKAVVIAAGCWSGSVVDNLIRDAGIKIDVPVKPRKGHLLILENFKPFNLNHGLMEAAYVSHESAKLSSTSTDSKTGFDATIASISMTATTDLSGKLVFGSSREIVGFDTKIDESIVERIWTRASEFFPVLKKSSLRDMTDRREVRVGLRPYMPGGKPLIAPRRGARTEIVRTTTMVRDRTRVNTGPWYNDATRTRTNGERRVYAEQQREDLRVGLATSKLR